MKTSILTLIGTASVNFLVGNVLVGFCFAAAAVCAAGLAAVSRGEEEEDGYGVAVTEPWEKDAE